MGEDLELINRLAIAYNKFPLREDHLIDAPSKIPNRLKGFRRLFAHYALPHFEQQQFSIHIAHSTKLGSQYKKNQATNMDYFQKKMKAAIEGFELSPVEENSLGDKKYLHSAPPIVLSRMERWQKKWQKLRRDPPLFFRDMFNK
jgi:predicted glycosyltransferase involved in capsule biosynthesis